MVCNMIIPEQNSKSYQWENREENYATLWQNFKVVVFPLNFWIQFFKVVVFPWNFWNATIIWQFFTVILNFAQEYYYLKNKVGVVNFTKAPGLVKFQNPSSLYLVKNRNMGQDKCFDFFTPLLCTITKTKKNGQNIKGL